MADLDDRAEKYVERAFTKAPWLSVRFCAYDMQAACAEFAQMELDNALRATEADMQAIMKKKGLTKAQARSIWLIVTNRIKKR